MICVEASPVMLSVTCSCTSKLSSVTDINVVFSFETLGIVDILLNIVQLGLLLIAFEKQKKQEKKKHMNNEKVRYIMSWSTI